MLQLILHLLQYICCIHPSTLTNSLHYC